MSGDTFEDSLFGYGEEFSPFEEIPQATLGSSVPCSPSHTFSHRIASVDFDSLETLAKGQVFPPHQPFHHLPTQTKVEEINSLFDIDDQEEEGADADSGIWEKDLDRLINDFDSQNIPLSQTTIDELVAAPVKAFHQRIKAMKLEKPHIQYLKASRKRLKNREAAIRSRNKKENRVLELQNLIQELQSKNLALQRRVEELEARQPNPSA